MFKMKCPVCKYEMTDKTKILGHKSYECSNCRSSLKVSNSYRITYIVGLFLASILGVLITDKLRQNTIFQRFIICPLILGACIGTISSIVVLLYPTKLSNL
ncbi:hypothetical protein [Clostridium akagii]|uniref:hypothetical protein n=1 Tax=Clostridium akagii TaxID=91623 RepID=UPI00047C6E27|nr:hypothetical protein [Clostridium akagii]